MDPLRKTIGSLLLGCALALPAPAQQWIHHSFSDDAIAKMLSAPIRPAGRSADPLQPDAIKRSRLELEETVAGSMARFDRTYERAKARVLPPPCLWPDTGWGLFNPGLDQWGIKGIPCPASPLPLAAFRHYEDR